MPIVENDAPITELFVFISTDADGNDGIVATNFGAVMMPLITSRPKVADLMKRVAADVGKQCGSRIRLIRLTAREEVEVIYGGRLDA